MQGTVANDTASGAKKSQCPGRKCFGRECFGRKCVEAVFLLASWPFSWHKPRERPGDLG